MSRRLVDTTKVTNPYPCQPAFVTDGISKGKWQMTEVKLTNTEKVK